MAKGVKTGGRQKGVPNKVTVELRDMILEALDKAGGVAYLQRQATQSPAAFLSLIGKILPMNLGDSNGGPLVVQIVKFAEVDPQTPS